MNQYLVTTDEAEPVTADEAEPVTADEAANHILEGVERDLKDARGSDEHAASLKAAGIEHESVSQIARNRLDWAQKCRSLAQQIRGS